MMLKPSDSYTAQFTTQHPDTAVATNADSLPTATATRNGTDDATFVLTVTNMTTGRYKITGTVPASYTAGDIIQVSVQATLATLSATAIVDRFTIDTQRNSDLNDFNPATQSVTVNSITTNALAEFFTTNSGTLFSSAVAGSVVKEIVDNVIVGAGSSDWTTTERQHIRYRLGIDGTAVAPTAAGDLPSIKTTVDAANLAALSNLDATVSSRSTFNATTDNVTLATSTSDWTTTERQHIRYRLGIDGTAVAPTAAGDLPSIKTTVDAANFAALANLDATVSSRSTFNVTTDNVTVNSITTNALAEFFTTNSGTLFSSAVVGSVVKEIVDNVIVGAGSSDWTATERQHIRYRLGIDGTAVAPTAAGDLPNLKATVDAANLAALANLDATVSSRSTFNVTTDNVTVNSITTNALAEFFTTNSGTLFSSAVAGSVVKEIVDNVIVGSGSSDWTTTERDHIRYRLGIDGTSAAPTATGDLSDIKTILQAATRK